MSKRLFQPISLSNDPIIMHAAPVFDQQDITSNEIPTGHINFGDSAQGEDEEMISSSVRSAPQKSFRKPVAKLDLHEDIIYATYKSIQDAAAQNNDISSFIMTIKFLKIFLSTLAIDALKSMLIL